MKKKTKIVLAILGVLIIAAIAVAVTQWNSISALKYYISNSEEDIEGLIENNNEAITRVLDKLPDVTIRDLTDEEREKLKSGEITQEEAIQVILGGNGTASANTAESSMNETDSSSQSLESESTESENNAIDGQLAELIAEVYVLRASFVNKLDGLIQDAKTEYLALPAEERTASKKGALGRKYLNLGLSLEADCDAKMNKLLEQIDEELHASGGDRSLVNDIKAVYETEKSLKKAEYLSRYSNADK